MLHAGQVARQHGLAATRRAGRHPPRRSAGNRAPPQGVVAQGKWTVTYNPREMAPLAMSIVDFGAFHHPPSALFRAHVGGDPRARPFYGRGFALDDVAAAAQGARQHERPIGDVVAALQRQQRARGAEAAAAAAGRLAQDAVAIVTGQQPVLFGGPLFVLYKALAAVQVARAMERTGRAAVPVFWVAADDHDFAEIRELTILDADGVLRTVRYVPRRPPSGQPASAIVLDDTVRALAEELGRALPAGLGRDAVVELVTACYEPGRSMADAFARLLSGLFPSLVVLDPSDPALKRAMEPVMARELAEDSPSSRLAMADGQRLLAGGFHQQVPVREGFLNLFLLWEGERRALASEDGTVEVRGTRARLSREEALALLRAEPERYSPGVLLRPLAQDHILPTAAYVGGPAEIAYQAQIGSSYAAFGIPRPALLPRPSVTIVEPAQSRALEAEGLKLADLQADPEQVVARWARQSHPEIEDAFLRLRADAKSGLAELAERLARQDPTLRGAADATVGRVLHQIDTLHEKSLRALKKKERARADRLRRTRDALLPGGSLQERGLSMVQLLSRQGLGMIDTLAETIDPWAQGHQVVTL
jgi:bacillithiol biosynthesis cysteine-adding enzyme BshC